MEALSDLTNIVQPSTHRKFSLIRHLDAENAVGVGLPKDYVSLCAKYGPGVFDFGEDELRLIVPFEQDNVAMGKAITQFSSPLLQKRCGADMAGLSLHWTWATTTNGHNVGFAVDSAGQFHLIEFTRDCNFVYFPEAADSIDYLLGLSSGRLFSELLCMEFPDIPPSFRSDLA
jgi:hypothetical protein